MTISTRSGGSQQRLERQQRHEHRRCIPPQILQRNETVLKHLGLAHLGAKRQLRKGSGERDDLVQEGLFGLILAIERFESSRGHRLSSYAMPRIIGQIQHFRRDRLHTLRIPWRLDDLHARGIRLLNRQLHAGLPRFKDEQIAKQLGVTTGRWQEACIAHQDHRVQSLNLPCRNDDANFDAETGIDRLQNPHRLQPDPQREWLLRTLKAMEPNHCRWLCAFWIDGLSLTEIARREGIDRQVLSKTLKLSLLTLRGQATREFSLKHPGARPLSSPKPQPKQSEDH